MAKPKSNPFVGYNRITNFTFALILAATGILCYVQFDERLDFHLSAQARQSEQCLSRIGDVVNIGVFGVSGVRTQAESYFASPTLKQRHPLNDLFKQNDSLGYFHLDNLPNEVPKNFVGNLTGAGRLDTLNPVVKEYINMALGLGSPFATTTENIPSVAGVYFLAADFMYFFPWVPSADLKFSKDIWTEQTFFADAMAKGNPYRNLVFSDAYIDLGGQGLMVTFILPIYKQSAFVGHVCFDVTLEALNNIVLQNQVNQGVSYLINPHEDLLAHPKLVQSSDSVVHKFKEAADEAFYSQKAVFDTLATKTNHYFAGKYVYTASVPNTDWKLVSVTEASALYWIIFKEIGMVLALALLSLSAIFWVSNYAVTNSFIKPSLRLIRHIKDESDGKAAGTEAPPKDWEMWFSIISGIFHDQRELVAKLEESNKTLENKVLLRTSEILSQQEELTAQNEKLVESHDNVNLLSQIGKKIMGSLDANEIILTTYESINKLMDAAVFSVGLYNPEEQSLDFPGSKENGAVLPFHSYSLADENRLAVWCFHHRKEIIINDFTTEYVLYVKQTEVPVAGESPFSIVYMPLIIKEEIIGVFTVQAFRKYAYTPYEIDILRNLAVYITIALENAKAYSQIDEQRGLIEKKNSSILASLNYARRIQDAMLPTKEYLQRHLPGAFILYKPRDIVSGDFYWFAKKDGKKIIAVVDCTGHGVPGAFMSLIGNDLLNDIVNLMGVTSPPEILQLLDEYVCHALRQKHSDNRDGMDMTLCAWDDKTGTLEFAGARNPLFYVKGGEIFEIKADKMPIGGDRKAHKEDAHFTGHSIVLEGVDGVYMASDGFQDQFGGDSDTKYLKKNLKKLILETSADFETQGAKLENAFNNWLGKHKQTDDILVIGFKPDKAKEDDDY